MDDSHAPTNLRCWSQVIENSPGLGQAAIAHLVDLIDSGTLGYYEGAMIMYHLMKDSGIGREFRGGPGGWLVSAVAEANEALRNMPAWEGASARPRGGGSSSSARPSQGRTGPRGQHGR